MKKVYFLFLVNLLLSGCEKENNNSGTRGSNGFTSLISTENETPGDNCKTGGIIISSGLDFNRNDMLDENEIQNSEFICNGNLYAGIHQINLNIYKDLNIEVNNSG